VADLSKVRRPVPVVEADPRTRARELRAQGLTVREIAAALDRPASTVGTWVKETAS